MSTQVFHDITACVLAGGRATRMGGQDKGLVEFRGKPMVAHVLERLAHQTSRILINANRNRESYAAFGYPVLSDQLSDFQGPLAGMASALDQCQTDYLMTVPCDCPFIPLDLAKKLRARLEENEAEICVASDGKREQPVFLLIKRELKDSMLAFLNAGERKIDYWYRRHQTVSADFSNDRYAFVNINSREDLDNIAEDSNF